MPKRDKDGAYGHNYSEPRCKIPDLHHVRLLTTTDWLLPPYARRPQLGDSESGFTSEKAAEGWGNEQEALIRRHMWIDPRDGDTPFGTFASEMLSAVAPRLEPSTFAKYRSHLDTHLLPQWSAWPMIGIFNNYVEIEKWVSELHEDYAESTVASVFATFSTMMNAAVRARVIPANPCTGIRVASGEFEVERLVASPAQALRAAMRLYPTAGPSGFVLCLMDLYTGARWGELAGQQRHEYDREHRSIAIQKPLKEIGEQLFKGGRRIGPGRHFADGPGATTTRKPTRREKGRRKDARKPPPGPGGSRYRRVSPPSTRR